MGTRKKAVEEHHVDTYSNGLKGLIERKEAQHRAR
jgi:hypothetical protein